MNDPNGGTPLSVHSVRFDIVVTLPGGQAARPGETSTVVQVTRFLPASGLDEVGLARLFKSVTKDLLLALDLRSKPRPLRE